MEMSRKERRKAQRKLKINKILDQPQKIASGATYTGLLGAYQKNYKKLLFIPFVILLLALISIGIFYAQTGDFINKGISLKGGVSITVPGALQEASQLEMTLQDSFSGTEINVRALREAGRQKGILVEADVTDNKVVQDQIIQELVSLTSIPRSSYAVESVGSSLGATFFRQTVIAMLIAFLFMGVVVFAYFRNFVPSLAVILAAFSDIVITLAVVNLMGVRVSTAGIAAFLMLIGYSVDTDILLTTRVLKSKEGSIFDRVVSALRTGLTMSATTLIAVSIAYIFAQSVVLKQIMLIIIIGLIVDIIMTWFQNAGLLRLYFEKKEVKK